MHEIMLKPGWETFLFAVPFLGVLFLGYFRLDEIFASRKRTAGEPRTKIRRPMATLDEDGQPVFSDPDGRRWRTRGRRR